MDKVKVLSVDTAPAQKSIKELRKELKAFKDQMANLDADSDAFKSIALQAGEVKHTIDEINESVKGASADLGDMIGNATNVAAGLVGAFQTVEGALQVMGVESEAVGDALLRMQGLMAMTEGLAAIDDAIKAFGKMKVAVQTVTTAMKGPQAIAITAITTAVTLVVLNWEKVKAAVFGVNEELERQKKLSQDTIPISEETKNIIEGQKTEGDRLKETLNDLEKAYANLGKAIGGLENNQDSNEIFRGWKKNLKEQGVEVKNQNELLQYLRLEYSNIGNAIEITKGKLADYNKANQEYDLETIEGQQKIVDRYLLLQKEREAYDIKSQAGYKMTNAEQEKYNLALQEEIRLKGIITSTNWGLILLARDEKDEEAKAELKRQNDLKETIALEEASIRKQITLQGVEYQSTLEYYNKTLEIYNLKKQLYENDKVAFENLLIDELAFIKQYGPQIADEYLKTPITGVSVNTDVLNTTIEDATARMTAFLNTVNNQVDNTSNKAYNTFTGIVSGLSSVSSQFVSILSTLATEQDITTEKGFKKQKAFNISASVINGLMGILNAWVSAMSPTNAWMTLPGQIAMGASQSALMATLMGIQIDSIKKQTLGSMTSLGSSTPAASALSAVTAAPVRQDVNTASINKLLNQKKDTRVYVLESDITDTQNKVNVQESENVF